MTPTATSDWQRQTVEQIDWTQPTVVLIHGWLSDENAVWINVFLQTAFDEEIGILRDIPDAQVVVVIWENRASPQTVLCERAWLSARNGYADGLALGAQLARQAVDPSRIDLVGHSNGSAFGAGIAQAFQNGDGRRLAHLTVLDAPSETDWLLSCASPPTGWIVQRLLETVERFDSWTVHQEQATEFGDLFTGSRVINFQTDLWFTRDVTRPWHRSLRTTHSKIPVRYALSTDKRFAGPERLYNEPGAFANISALVRPEPFTPDTAQESKKNEWRLTNQWRTPGIELWPPFRLVSPEDTWRGLGACAYGSEVYPAFQLEGDEICTSSSSWSRARVSRGCRS